MMQRRFTGRPQPGERHGKSSVGKSSVEKSSLVEVTIHGLAGGGDGVARLPPRDDGADPGVVFVSDTAPGDRALVSITHPPGRRRWQRGHLLEVREAGPGRREPRCDLSLLCGGCQWHHLSYEAQLLGKQEILARALRQARLDVQPPPVTPAPRPLAYRARARVHLERRPDGAMGLGFRARRSHRLVETLHCPVLVPALEALLPRLGRALQGAPEGELLLHASSSGACGVALRPFAGEARGLPPGLAALLGEGLGGALILGPDGEPLETWGSPWLNLALGGEASHLGAPHLFAQANPESNQTLRARVAAWAAEALASAPASASGSAPVVATTDTGATPSTGPRILELYAGSGNLTRDLAALGPVLAVESHPGALALGRNNLAHLPVTWLGADTSEALASIVSESHSTSRGSAFDLVVLDPPRTGAREAMEPLIALSPPAIIYVSCEPMTLARDVALLAQAGYAPVRLEALDTMPQTAHFETLMELRPLRHPGRGSSWA